MKVWGVIAARAPWQYGRALSFDGLNDFVDFGSLGIPVNGPATLEGWFRWRDRAKERDGHMMLFDRFYQHSANNYLYFSGTADLFYWAPQIDRWYHLVVTYNGDTSTARLFVDGGAPINAAQQATEHNITCPGRVSDSVSAFDGLIDSVRIYNRDLSRVR